MEKNNSPSDEGNGPLLLTACESKIVVVDDNGMVERFNWGRTGADGDLWSNDIVGADDNNEFDIVGSLGLLSDEVLDNGIDEEINVEFETVFTLLPILKGLSPDLLTIEKPSCCKLVVRVPTGDEAVWVVCKLPGVVPSKTGVLRLGESTNARTANSALAWSKSRDEVCCRELEPFSVKRRCCCTRWSSSSSSWWHWNVSTSNSIGIPWPK